MYKNVTSVILPFLNLVENISSLVHEHLGVASMDNRRLKVVLSMLAGFMTIIWIHIKSVQSTITPWCNLALLPKGYNMLFGRTNYNSVNGTLVRAQCHRDNHD